MSSRYASFARVRSAKAASRPSTGRSRRARSLGISLGQLTNYGYPAAHHYEIYANDPITVQGGRVFDANMAAWTTPDASKGATDDPASMERYMWNEDKAAQYSDPTGFCPEGSPPSCSDVTVHCGCAPPLATILGSVYIISSENYVGRTQNFATRSAFYTRNGLNAEEIRGTENFSKFQDQCLEGFLVCQLGLRRFGGLLSNKIQGVNNNTPYGRAKLTEGLRISESMKIDPLGLFGNNAEAEGEVEELPEVEFPIL